MEKNINPNMFQLARESRGLTQKDLSECSGISQGFVSKFEKGQKGISDLQLSKICKILDYPESFFFQEGSLFGLGIGTVYHRKRKIIPVQKLKLIQAEISRYILLLPKIMDNVEFETPNQFCNLDIDDYDGNAAVIANYVRAQWHIPLGPIDNMIEVVEKVAGVVILCDFGGTNFDAASVWLKEKGLPPFFFMNRKVSTDRLRFTLAHELGHLIMHTMPNPQMEEQANIFASEFLMPREEISEDLNPFSLKRVIRLKLKWKVSIAALIKRAFDLKVINESQYKYYFSQLSAAGYRKVEPFEIEKEEPQLLKRLISFYRNNLHYSDQELQKTLLINSNDFRSMFLSMPNIRVSRAG
ncbi:MAG: XRE family transcriptional regulator [Sedimentisphaerales bacterium]